MLAIALVIFREVLEAALIIGIIAAATQGIAGRHRWIMGGIALGITGAIGVAAGAEVLANIAGGMGQEYFNALVLSLAVAMLAWHNIWMTQHGKELAQQAKTVGQRIQSGTHSLSVLLSVIGLAVLREGAEVVLFVYGMQASESNTPSTLWIGSGLGLLAGSALGWAIYRGLLRIPLKWFFKATGLLILLLAAGMAAQAARFLIQADALPSLIDPLWDVSDWVALDSLFGHAMHVLAGYDPQPSGMQMLVYGLTLLTISSAMWWVNRRNAHPNVRMQSGMTSTATHLALRKAR
jgi:high-affinity iron transporter